MESRENLRQACDELSGQIERFTEQTLWARYPILSDNVQLRDLQIPSPQDIQLVRSAQRLSNAVALLLPPRGPSMGLDCPYCGNSVNISLSK